MASSQEIFTAVALEHGCVFVAGFSQYCRATCDANDAFCPRHEAMIALMPPTKREKFEQTTRTVRNLRHQAKEKR